jgi:hypothetical protein
MRVNQARGVSMGRITNVGLVSPHDASLESLRRPKSQSDKTRHCRTTLAAAWDQNPKRHKFRGAAYRLAAARRSPAGSVLEPARPKMAGEAPRDLTSRSAAFRPDGESWDFVGSVLTSARIRTRRSPMQTHETSPVSGASVVGMTSGACQGSCYLLAGVPGISTALG